jgi:hypothetical protein
VLGDVFYRINAFLENGRWLRKLIRFVCIMNNMLISLIV